MDINKFQKLGFTFDLSAKDDHIWVPSIYDNIAFSETTRPIWLKFHMKIPYYKLAKSFANCSGHLTKMATMPKYGPNPFKFFLQNQKADDLGTWYVALTKFAQMINLGQPWPTLLED